MLKAKNIFTAFSALLTVLILMLFIVVGNILESANSSLLREISYFVSPYTTGKTVTVPLFFIYNLMLFVFSVGLSIRLRNIYAKLGSACLIGSSVTGFFLILFPMDPSPVQSAAGLVHNIFVVIMSFFIILALSLYTIAFQHMVNLHWLAKYSSVTSVILFAALLTTMYFAYYNRTLMSIVERLSIGGFLLWMILVAIGIIRSDKRVKYLPSARKRKVLLSPAKR